jgi:hypothetical protein
MANPIIKIKRGSTTPANGALAAGELAIDLTNLNLFVGKSDGTALAVGGSGTFATKAYADAAVSAANSSLTDAIEAEETARIAADTTLQNNIDTEKSRIDAILSASTADKDSFAEIVDLINSVDTENDSAFAGYVISNDAALATEVTNRTNADTALGGRIDDVESDAIALAARVTTAEADIVTNAGAISSEATTRANADSALDTRVTALETQIDGGTY